MITRVLSSFVSSASGCSPSEVSICEHLAHLLCPSFDGAMRRRAQTNRSMSPPRYFIPMPVSPTTPRSFDLLTDIAQKARTSDTFTRSSLQTSSRGFSAYWTPLVRWYSSQARTSMVSKCSKQPKLKVSARSSGAISYPPSFVSVPRPSPQVCSIDEDGVRTETRGESQHQRDHVHAHHAVSASRYRRTCLGKLCQPSPNTILHLRVV